MKNIIPYVFGNILYFVSYLFPKSNKIWVFGAWGGEAFNDNPKYLYNYIVKNHPDYKPVWLTRSPEVKNKIEHEQKNVALIRSLKGIWYSCRAKVGITSHGMIDLNRFACGRMEIVETWHGIPFKPVLLSDPKIAAIKKRNRLMKLGNIFPFLKKGLNYQKCLTICGSAPFTNQILERIFGSDAPVNDIGFPRLDGIFSPNKQLTVSSRCISLKEQNKKIGIYMPTYRREGEFDIINLFLDHAEFIEDALQKENLHLFLKIHPFDFHKFPRNFTSKSIDFIDDGEIEGDIYQILGLFDFLVTDYSSIIFDFLIIPRPVYLLVPDRNSYIESNGDFVFDYKELGLPESNNWNELMSLIQANEALDSDKLFHALGKKIHSNQDGKNSERLFNHILKELD